MIQIDFRDPRPIYEQIVGNVEQLVLSGALQPDTQLPSVRQLAVELSINPNTIQRAYSELESNGVIYSARGRGNFVSDASAVLKEKRLDEVAQEITALAARARLLGANEEQLQAFLKGGDNR